MRKIALPVCLTRHLSSIVGIGLHRPVFGLSAMGTVILITLVFWNSYRTQQPTMLINMNRPSIKYGNSRTFDMPTITVDAFLFRVKWVPFHIEFVLFPFSSNSKSLYLSNTNLVFMFCEGMFCKTIFDQNYQSHLF